MEKFNKKTHIYYIIALIIILVGMSKLSAQDVVSDSLLVVTDTLKSNYSEYSKADSLQYSAEDGFFNIKDNTVGLSGNARINYEDINVEADSLFLDLENKKAYSTGDALIKQDGQLFLSQDIKMDIDSKKGILADGSGSVENGYLYGDQIRKISDKVYDIDNGIYTTCDHINPHYYIKGKKLRVYFGDKIAGKPFVYYVNHVPIMAFPFATFTIKRGRHSGVLIPQPGWNSSDGKYLKNIAYYYAYKDYFDSKIAFDYYEKKGWNLSFDNRYIQRYIFNGKLNFRITQREYSNTSSELNWSLTGTHYQTFRDQSTLTANINYATSKKIYESSTSIDERLIENMNSTITYNKRFDNSTFNISSSYRQNFVDDSKSVTLPKFSYTPSSVPIYEVLGYTRKEVKGSWWEKLSYKYSLYGSHNGTIKEANSEFSDIIWDNSTEALTDSTEAIVNQHNAGLKHVASLTFSPHISDYFNVSQSFSYNEAWYDRDKNDNKFARGYSYSTRSSINTKLYGLSKINLGSLRAIRHVLTPQVSFNYAPDFSNNSKYYSFGNISVGSGKRNRTIGFSLGQLWQIKYYDSVSKSEKKINNMINFTSSGSYNLEKESRKLSDLTHKLSFKPSGFSIADINTTYSASLSFNNNPYDREWLDLNFRNFKLNQSLSFSGKSRFFTYFPQAENPLKSGKRVLQDTLKYANLDWDYYNKSSESKNWTLSFSNSTSFTKDIFNVKSNSLTMNANMNLTKNWSLNYNNSLDLLEGEILTQRLGLERDLHCWSLSFDYTKSNEYWEWKVVLTNKKLADMMKFPLEGRK
jgi:lipopolysaccharide assembly outer membrane protein LptD (OstA)